MAALAESAEPGWRGLTVRGLRCWLTVYRRTWRSSVYSSVLGPLFFLGAMGFGLGSLVNRHGTAGLGGVPYLAFVAPAILATQAMQTAMSESTFPVYGAVKWNKLYIAARATPLRPADIYRGHLLFIVIRLAMNSVVFLAIAVAALPAAVLCGLAFPVTGLGHLNHLNWVHAGT
jgi:lipooligosaccharide transport system permease protein